MLSVIIIFFHSDVGTCCIHNGWSVESANNFCLAITHLVSRSDYINYGYLNIVIPKQLQATLCYSLITLATWH